MALGPRPHYTPPQFEGRRKCQQQEHHEHHGAVVSHVRQPKAKSRSMLGIGTAATLHPHNPRVVASANGRNIMSISFSCEAAEGQKQEHAGHWDRGHTTPPQPEGRRKCQRQEHHEHHGAVVSHVRQPKAKSRSMLGIGTAATLHLHPHNPRVIASANGRNIILAFGCLT